MRMIDPAIVRFSPEHLGGAVRLSRMAGWPHRPEDWQLALALSEGFVAIGGSGEVVGTILLTAYERDCATVNMVIVDHALRGRGLGRRLMDAALELAGDLPLRLVATEEGLPLYEKLGFRASGTILQHQGVVVDVAPPHATEDATAADMSSIAALDRMAFGADRGELIGRLAAVGAFAVIRRGGHVAGFAAMRGFGRGEVVGPVVAADLADAKTLISHFMSRRGGGFLRVDTSADTGLAPWLAGTGLAHVGGGIAMARPPVEAAAARPVTTFALANQALG